MTKAEIVRELLDKPKFREMPNNTFARFLREKHPNVFSSVERARDIVRMVKGVKTKSDKMATKDPNKTKYFQEALDNLPEPEEPFITTQYSLNHDRYKRAGVMCDVHVGHHDPTALKTAIVFLKGENIDNLVVNGDVFDGRSVSHWERDLKSFDAQKELQQNRLFWGAIRKAFPNIPITYKFGNHEVWWQRYLRDHCVNISGIPEFQLEIILKLQDFNIDYVPDLDSIKYGKTMFLHGHEFKSKSSAFNISRTNFNKCHEDAIYGDAHKTDQFIYKTPSGQEFKTYNIGCLCNLQAPFRPYNQWNHGTGIVHILDKEGNYEVENKRILNGKVL